MTHIKITNGGGATPKVIIDGREVQDDILADGFSVDVGDAYRQPTVTMTIPADVLEIDLPDAVVRALRLSDDGDDS